MLDHGKAKSAAIRFTKSTNLNLKHMPNSTSCPKSLITVADDFVILQEARHKADYDFNVKFSRRDSILMHARSKRSIEALRSCRNTCAVELQAFLLELLQVRN